LKNLAELAMQTERSVVAVTHGGLIKTALRVIVGTDLVDFRVYNATISGIEWKDGRWKILFLNRWDHLPQSLRTL